MVKKLPISIFCLLFFPVIWGMEVELPSPNEAQHYAFHSKKSVSNVSLRAPIIEEHADGKPSHIKTLYGNFYVNEPVLIALFDCWALLRIKDIHQYGFVSYLHPDTAYYTRYVHSVGVWALLRRFGASIEEQIVGLLHDVSHTVFSHVGDYLYNHSAAVRGTSYQDDIHEQFLREMGVDVILARYGYLLNALLSRAHPMLDQPSPEVCADRLEYTLQAGLINKSSQTGASLIDRDDLRFILKNLKYDFDSNHWFFRDIDAAKKFALISLYTTEFVVGSAWNHIVYSWMADALREELRGPNLNERLIRHGRDQEVWEILNESENKNVQGALYKIKHYTELIHVCDEDEPCDIIAHTKFRGINPLVTYNNQLCYLTDIDPDFNAEYYRVKNLIAQGWRVKFVGMLEGIPQNISTVIS